MNDHSGFELTACDKNIKIRAEAVVFILVCSIASFSFSTANYNVTLLHEKDLFLSCVCSKESLSYVRDLKAHRMQILKTEGILNSLR